MGIKMKPISVIKANLGIQNGGEVHAYLTATCARYNDPYVPYREGDLAKTVILDGQPTENVGVNYYSYVQPYARYVYLGISKSGKEMNYTKDDHPLATSYWDKHMWSARKQDILDEVHDFMKKRGKK